MRSSKRPSRNFLPLLTFFLILTLVNPQPSLGYTERLNETFDFTGDWDFVSYTSTYNASIEDSLYWIPVNENRAKVESGNLKFTDPDLEKNDFQYVTCAFINATANYGHLSFDFTADGGYSDFYITFAFSQKDNIYTHPFYESKVNWTGYGLGISTGNDARPYKVGFTILKYQPAADQTLKSKTLDFDKQDHFINNWNHIDFVRQRNGTLMVLINGYLEMTVADGTNPVTQPAETIMIANFNGDTRLDNIKLVEYDSPSDEFVYTEPNSKTSNTSLGYAVIATGLGVAVLTLSWLKGKKNF